MGTFWTYPNAIESAVLLVILVDVIWHFWNATEDITRDKQRELRAIQREEALEKRQIRREHQELIRKHWQEMQSNIILLNRIGTYLTKQRNFLHANSPPKDATTLLAVSKTIDRLPQVISEFDDAWSRIVAQLNVFPRPGNPLAIEVYDVIQEVGKTVGDKQIELKDETLHALVKLVEKVATAGALSNPDGS